MFSTGCKVRPFVFLVLWDICNITYSSIYSHAYAWLNFSFLVQIFIIRKAELEQKPRKVERVFSRATCQKANRKVSIIQRDAFIFPEKIYDEWKGIQFSTKIRNTNQMVLSSIIRAGHSNDCERRSFKWFTWRSSWFGIKNSNVIVDCSFRSQGQLKQVCKAVFSQIRGAGKQAQSLKLGAVNYWDTIIDWDNNCAAWSWGRPVQEGQACFLKQFIELSACSQAILALILGNWRSLGGVEKQWDLDWWEASLSDDLWRENTNTGQVRKCQEGFKVKGAPTFSDRETVGKGWGISEQSCDDLGHPGHNFIVSDGELCVNPGTDCLVLALYP